MDEGTHRLWDIIIKVVGLIALMSSGAWTYYTYRPDRRSDLEHQRQQFNRDEETRKRELNSFIFQRQSQLYFDAFNSEIRLRLTLFAHTTRSALLACFPTGSTAAATAIETATATATRMNRV
jgi:hypothetical protein